jgi:hypothetical protein
MNLFDIIRNVFIPGDSKINYRDADPHLEPDGEDSRGYKKSQFQTRQFSYLYEIGDEFDAQREEAPSIQIGYHGLLKNCGADAVYLHYGFDNWDNRTIHTAKMQQYADGGFHLWVASGNHREINYCFKDSADHWDNNSGQDWSIRSGRFH